ncbi:MAG: thymidine phosphorylase [Clostridiales bacterium]|nr:thymidine phosphorylase [Clostridiales bacterium]
MDILSVIETKKQGQPLSREQIRFFVRGAADGTLPDYQLAALLMAIRLQGMNAQETADLTMEMAASGSMLKPDVSGVPVDKHSTGGVGDTTTLILAPLVAACGGKVLKMSGRGLGHTGGTVDKLESIRGMQVELPEDTFVSIVREVGCCVVGQSARLAPADKRLYALRDVTGTVDSIPLIASSILSKKFAAGASAIVLDVKTGSGALMPTLDRSIDLAKTMVDIGNLAGRKIIAVVSGMDEPLGSHVGNALEVKEAVDVLSGRTEGPLKEVSLFLGAQMLVASGVCENESEAQKQLDEALSSGRGLEKLKEMIRAQGGDSAICDDVTLLPKAPCIRPVYAKEAGWLAKVNGVALGMAAQQMGAGRATKEDAIDPAVGFVMEKRIGDWVDQGDVICILHAKDEASATETQEKILAALSFSPVPVPPARLIYALVTPEGVSNI